ncbi:uncharacterized protein LOC122478562 [Prionailurus bengalensis]|uniref:uncharacterized protein LOC122478562 n=1 Tax=Prionailurus bengalensis TaxID=37029 RepID=UPI001CA82F3C|nr:uncharacterized protein LOC122478562 [Prionailurus bengalensis]
MAKGCERGTQDLLATLGALGYRASTKKVLHYVTAGILEQVHGFQTDLTNWPLPDAEATWFTDDSSFVRDGHRYAGAVVVTETDTPYHIILFHLRREPVELAASAAAPGGGGVRQREADASARRRKAVAAPRRRRGGCARQGLLEAGAARGGIGGVGGFRGVARPGGAREPRCRHRWRLRRREARAAGGGGGTRRRRWRGGRVRRGGGARRGWREAAARQLRRRGATQRRQAARRPRSGRVPTAPGGAMDEAVGDLKQAPPCVAEAPNVHLEVHQRSTGKSSFGIL